MSRKLLSILNLLLLIFLIFWNYYANSGIFDGKTIGSISDKYDSLFTPAGYAFSIWGVIFLGLIVNGVYLIYLEFKTSDPNQTLLKSAPYLIIVNTLNALWVYWWLSEQLLFSVITMVLILIVLLIAVVKLRMELWDASLKTIVLVWWPIDLYVGWIAVALVANTSSYLNFLDFNMGLKEEVWVIIMIVVVTLINYFMVQKRNMREFAAVGIWALIAIAVRHWASIPSIAYSAILASAFLFILNGIHANRNKETLPFLKRKWEKGNE